jgi:hypothetical protein
MASSGGVLYEQLKWGVNIGKNPSRGNDSGERRSPVKGKFLQAIKLREINRPHHFGGALYLNF